MEINQTTGATIGAPLPMSSSDVGLFAGRSSMIVRFRFDTKDGFNNSFEGVYLDDVLINP